MSNLPETSTETLVRANLDTKVGLHDAYTPNIALKWRETAFNGKSGMEGKHLRKHGRTHKTAIERREITW